MATEAGEIGLSLIGHGGSTRIQLAREPDFPLGPLTVRPSRRCIVTADGSEETIEPRVMQVLVALCRAGGQIVGRDELVELCWDGRFVGEDAINRVISRLRRIAETVSRTFSIETVPRVGYRLAIREADSRPDVPAALPPGGAADEAARRPEQPATSPPALPAPFNRRALLGGLATTAAAASVAPIWSRLREAGWFGLRGHVPDVEAQRFYDQGMRAQYQGIAATSDQAEVYFRQAARLDPEWADAWGSLAMSYRHMLDGETNAGQWRLVEQTRSAAARALAIEPDNAEALVALALIRPPYRRWAQAEAEYKALLARFPRAFVLRGHLGLLLRGLGRYNEAVSLTRETARQQRFVALVSINYAKSLWGAGRLQEAETEFDRGISMWPKNLDIWFSRVEFLTYTGQFEAAIAFANDRDGRPADLPTFLFDRRIAIARALETGLPTDIAAAVQSQETFVARSLSEPYGVVPVDIAVPFFAAIGDLNTAFALLEGYYFDRGRYVPPGRRQFGQLTQRDTTVLFAPPTAALRRDRRFKPLLEEIGLIDHWRKTGTGADNWPGSA